MAGSLIGRLANAQTAATGSAAPSAAGTPRTNWAGNYTYSTDNLKVANSVDDVRAGIAAQTHVKALGARHSFNGIADSTQEQISVKPMTGIELNAAAHTVKVGAGVTYGQLAPVIDKQGFAVHNMASLPHISVVGACATATHGSGIHNGNLSTAVRAMEIVTADGKLVTFSRDSLGEAFDGTVVHLGALGVITSITLAVEPSFQMTQVVYENLPFAELEHNLETIFSSAYSVSLFTDWQHGRATQVWLKRKLAPGESPQAQLPPQFYGATLATQKMHPITGHSAENCTDQMNEPGPWYERLPHFKMNFTPSSGAEIQTEYFVPREKGYAALRAVEELHAQITPHLFVTELRMIAADDLWLSPCYKQDSMTIHFTWKPEAAAVQELLPLIEAKLAPFGGTPHWAKVFTTPASHFAQRYQKMADFKALAAKYDSAGKFRNAYLNRNLFGA